MMTNVEELKNRAQVSDLMDGRLRSSAFAHAVDMVSASGDGRAAWHANHVIGDVLRFGDAAGVAADAEFVDRFRLRLAQMPGPGQVGAEWAGAHAASVGSGLDQKRVTSANDSSFRWKILTGVASIVAVVAMGWSALINVGTPGAAPGAGAQLAQSSGLAPAGPETQVMIRDPHLDALLAAHKQFGGTSALQMPAGFLRNATFESPSR
jgi:sigma-E factor negative regulatory protein RseA